MQHLLRFKGCACPSISPNVIAVAAHEENYNAADFTLYGPCVDVYAPGVI